MRRVAVTVRAPVMNSIGIRRRASAACPGDSPNSASKCWSTACMRVAMACCLPTGNESHAPLPDQKSMNRRAAEASSPSATRSRIASASATMSCAAAGAAVVVDQPAEQHRLVGNDAAHLRRVQGRELQRDRGAIGMPDEVRAAGFREQRRDERRIVGQRQRRVALPAGRAPWPWNSMARTRNRGRSASTRPSHCRAELALECSSSTVGRCAGWTIG